MVHDEDGAVGGRVGLLAKEPVAVEEGQQRPAHVHQADDRVGGPGNPGGSLRRQDLAGGGRREPAHQPTDPEDQHPKRAGIIHLL